MQVKMPSCRTTLIIDQQKYQDEPNQNDPGHQTAFSPPSSATVCSNGNAD